MFFWKYILSILVGNARRAWVSLMDICLQHRRLRILIWKNFICSNLLLAKPTHQVLARAKAVYQLFISHSLGKRYSFMTRRTSVPTPQTEICNFNLIWKKIISCRIYSNEEFCFVIFYLCRIVKIHWAKIIGSFCRKPRRRPA